MYLENKINNQILDGQVTTSNLQIDSKNKTKHNNKHEKHQLNRDDSM